MRLSGAWWLAIAVAGCTYPDFQFGGDAANADAADDTTIADTASPGETAPSDTFEATIDSATNEDSTVMDSSMDTFMPDTFKPDTFKPDTMVVDTFKPDVVDAPVSTGCTGSTATFCADWDKSTLPETDFTYPAVSPTATLSLDMSGGRSLPTAFVARTAPSPTEDVVVANLSKVFTAGTADALLKIDAYFKLESATFPTATGGGAFLLKIQRHAGEGDGVTFSLDGGGFYVDRIGVTYDYYPISSPKPKAGVWTHVRMHVKLHTTAGSAIVWIDDMTTPVVSQSMISTVKADTTQRQLVVGLYSQKASAPFTVRYDDVALSY